MGGASSSRHFGESLSGLAGPYVQHFDYFRVTIKNKKTNIIKLSIFASNNIFTFGDESVGEF